MNGNYDNFTTIGVKECEQDDFGNDNYFKGLYNQT